MLHRVWAGVLVLVLVAFAALPLLGHAAAERAVAAPVGPAAAVHGGDDRGGQATRGRAAIDDSLQAPSADASSGVRALPLFAPDGFVAQQFPAGDGLEDAARVRAAAEQLAARYGLPSLDGLLTPWVTAAYDEYPYRYDPLDDVVAGNLDLEAVHADPTGFVDLTSLLVVLSTLDQQPPSTQDENTWGSALAYSLLDHARTEVQHCDIATNLAFVVGLGMSPDPATVQLEHEQARRLCGNDDPTPVWARAKAAATLARVGPDERPLDQPEQQRRRAAEDAFAELRRSFPELPVGHAGHADLLLAWADQAEDEGAMPFQRRVWAERAVELYRSAREVSADARLLVGHGRALAAAGRPEDALPLVERAAQLRPEDLATSVVRTEVLSALGRHGEAAEVIQSESELAVPWWQGYVQPNRPDHLAGAYAVEEFPPLAVADASLLEGGGAYVTDLSFVPRWRYSTPHPACRGAVLMHELLLAGDIDGLLAVLDDGLSPVAMGDGAACEPDENVGFRWQDPRLWRLFADLVGTAPDQALTTVSGSGVESPEPDPAHAVSELFDHWQDVHRSAGDYAGALRSADTWVQATPEDARAWQRRGEIHYLAGDHDAALDDLTRAVEVNAEAQAGFDESTWDAFGSYAGDEQLDPHQLEVLLRLQRGAALEELDRPEDARAAYLEGVRLLDDPSAPSLVDSGQGSSTTSELKVAAYSQLGTLDLSQERWDSAEDHLRTAVRTGRQDYLYTEQVELPDGRTRFTVTAGGPLSGAQESNLALALVNLDRHEDAVPFAEVAVARDPANPVFLDNLALALQETGRSQAAGRAYDRTVAADATSFVALNNRAVSLARGGEWERATQELQALVRARPDYATAWHNLAVAWAHDRWSLPAYLRSQGAFARAVKVSSDYRGAEPRLVVDRTAYDARLDVSRPVPDDWEYGAATAPTQQRLLWSLIVLLVLRVAWVLGVDQLGSWALNRGLGGMSARIPRLGTLHLPPVVALTVSILCVLGLSVLWTPGLADLLGVAGLAAMVTLPLVGRRLVAQRHGRTLRHSTWSPALVAAAVATPVGIAFAPYPVVHGQGTTVVRGLLRWLPAIVVGTATAVFGLVAWLSGAPAVSLVAGSGLVLLTSILTPIAPLDGAELRHRRAQLLVTGLLAAGTVLVGLNWL